LAHLLLDLIEALLLVSLHAGHMTSEYQDQISDQDVQRDGQDDAQTKRQVHLKAAMLAADAVE